jgi:twitching motility protein PilT
MNLEALVRAAYSRGASDVHVEAARPIVARVRGDLERLADSPSPAETEAAARALVDEPHWIELSERRSHDFSRQLAGIRCRINVFHTSRGVAFALRLLADATPTIETLNLLPELRDMAAKERGLVLVSGSAGSGKSSTLAALIQEVSGTSRRHVITLENPIEYVFDSELALIRQREVGTHAPSFEQGFTDALREDPDVLMVGEMRHPDVMRWTLNFAQTGHLVFTAVDAADTIHALQRIAMAFPPEDRASVCAQIADSFIAVIAQRLVYRPDLPRPVPECEILTTTSAVRDLIRQGQFLKLESALTAGAKEGMYTWERYRAWLATRTHWHVPSPVEPAIVDEPREPMPESVSPTSPPPPPPQLSPAKRPISDPDVITIEPGPENLADLVSRLRPTTPR